MANRKSSGSSSAANHFQECAFGIRIRQSTMRARISVPSSKITLRARPLREVDLRHRGRSADLHPQLLPGGRERLRDRAHAAHHVAIEALQFMLTAAQQMKQQPDRSARLIRPAMLAINVVGQKHGLHLLGFVIVVEKLAQAAGEKRNQLRDFCAGNSAKTLAHAKQIGPSAQACGIDLRRRLQKEGLQIARQLLQLVVHLGKALRVLDGNACGTPPAPAVGRPTTA